MSKMISNIVFTKNRPLQLDAYLESLYNYFPSEIIQTHIIYKQELFAAEYNQLFHKFNTCNVIRETVFHSDFMRILDKVQTKYILFGVDDVVFFDSVNFEVIDETFNNNEDIFGFTLRFSPESLKNSGDVIEECSSAGQKIYRLNWKKGHTEHTNYPFELCCTFYLTELVKKIIYGSMNNSFFAKRLFGPSSVLINFMAKIGRKRSTLKHFGYFFSPNTLESWPCKWCQSNSEKLPNYTYFQKQCASAIQVNIVNTCTKNAHDGMQEHTVEKLNDKYKKNYRFDLDYIANNKPSEPGCSKEYFKLKMKQNS